MFATPNSRARFRAIRRGFSLTFLLLAGFNLAASVSFGSTTVSPCSFGPTGPCFSVNSDNLIYVSTPPQGTNPARPYFKRTIYIIGKDGKIAYADPRFNVQSQDAWDKLAAEIKKAKAN